MDISSLVSAANAHTANGLRMAEAISDIASRTRTLETTAVVVTGVEATLDSHAAILQTILDRISALSGSAPPAPKLSPTPKRAREDDVVEAPAKRAHLAPNLVLPPTFSLPTAPPAPQFAAPGFAAPAAPPAPLELPTAPPALPRAPPSSNPPRVHVDSAREVLFGPLDWEGNHKNTPRNLILNVLSNVNMRNARFTSRKGGDEESAILTFDAPAVAEWFTTTWNSSSRVGYTVCVARPMLSPPKV
ncbi:hypothetical protein B0H16DRAFT_1606138 [Mycena metata]|uniref:Uncharacterized protein n=1 Tax=Mycena metata TaxID=1033252 RepID=A0AAD7HFG1_9AGAR|nr:hypothetical protein B0H16DRAFT_1606138 [Mycena metata]